MDKDAIDILKEQMEQALNARKTKADQMQNLQKEYIELTERATKLKNAIVKLQK